MARLAQIKLPNACFPIYRINHAVVATTSQLVAAIAGKTFRLLGLKVVCRAATNTFYIGDGTAALLGTAAVPYVIDASGSIGPPGLSWEIESDGIGHCETQADNRPLRIVCGTGSGVIVTGSYVEIGYGLAKQQETPESE